MASSLDWAVSRPSSGVASPPQRMPSRSRTQSVSSDRPSTVAHSLMSPPLSVSPEPAFIAASAASQIVTNDHDSHAETWYDQHGIEPSGETAAVSPAALQLVNSFLDQLLFNFLCVSRTTTLSALRPAVSEVLKPKLAKDAINQADEELREYLGGDDEDSAQANAQDPAATTDWDLELVWKRTRLRCMVYSSLGDMEEEDEDYYMEQEHLDAGLEDRFSEAVSPAVAIFLTSILEFMGEQALIVAGQAAYHRMRLKYEKELKDGLRNPTGIADRILIEELDMERVALDRTLGRLWRSWKKKIRSPAMGSVDRLARSYSKDSLHSAAGHVRSPSAAAEFAVPATVLEPDVETEQQGPGESREQAQNSQEQDPQEQDPQDQSSQEPLEEYLVAASIPLPLGPNDVAEIEVPGLALYLHDVMESEVVEKGSWPADRPKSLIILPPRGIPDSPTAASQSHTQRRRSNSLPASAEPRFGRLASVQQAEANDCPAESTSTSTETTGLAPDKPVDIQADTGEESPATKAGTDLVNGEPVDEDDDMKEDVEDEVSIEEPRIVRSSRVSILGRSPSTTPSEHRFPTAIDTDLPLQTPSIHSARLIDVTGPRSPVVNSRRNSAVVAESARHSSPARTSRTVTPPVPEDQSGQQVDSGSVGRLTISAGNRSGLVAAMSIPEREETADKGITAWPVTPVTPTTQASAASLSALQHSAPKDQHEAAGVTEQEIIPEPSTPPKPITKVTILPATSSPASIASTASSIFYIESMPVLTEESEIQEGPHTDRQQYLSGAAVQPPVVPERSSGRQAVANTSALRQPATIGQVSVERSRPRSPSEGSSSRPRESSTGRGRQQHSSGSPSSTKLKAVRTSEEGTQARIDVVRNFEELIQSDQTIQYTLTPESMRDLEPQSQSARSLKTRKSEEARQNGSRSRSSSVPRNDTKPPSSAPHSPGSGSLSFTDTHHLNRNLSTSTGKHGGIVPRSIPPMPSKTRATNGPQARDPRLARESLAEFAEFIRSTGPPGRSVAPAPSPAPAPVPVSTPTAVPSGLGRVRHTGSMSNISIDPGRMSMTSNTNRPRLQARGAAVDYKDDNSDLIDFIRRGPPNGPTKPRIPRTVAPFRSTMDSDQMKGAIGGRAVDAQLRELDFRSSQTSTNATESSVPPSIQSSVNSHSALLARPKPMSYDTVEGDMPIPKRKTRRVRDPYAIDLSDEELEDDGDPAPMPPKRPQTNEESLIDFLNSYTPPPEPTVQPFNIAQTRNALKPKKKASAPSLMARLTRRDSTQSGFPGLNTSSGPKLPESRSLSSRASGAKAGHIPIQANFPGRVDAAYRPPTGTSSKATAMLGGGGRTPGTHGGGGRVAMKRFEPREAVSVPTRGTSDLADFFKHSGPPPEAAPMVSQFTGQAARDEANGISKVFSRRKKPSFS